MSLIKSQNILGLTLTGAGGAKLGAVRETFVDLTRGTIAFLIVESPSLLGGSGKYHPVPWALVRFDAAITTLRTEITKDQFKSSPSYDRGQLTSAAYAWDDQANKYFGIADAPLELAEPVLDAPAALQRD